MHVVDKRYLDDSYLQQNPTWDQEDSPWKAKKVTHILNKNRIEPLSICEVGCGAGAILGALKHHHPDTQYTGYDIAPDAERFWKPLKAQGIHLHVGDFFQCDAQKYDVLLLLDVLEHVADPHDFLLKLQASSDYLVVHFPLDLSALSVLRETPLLHVRRKVGHIHSFTKGLALELLAECGYEVLDVQYTDAAMSAPQRTLTTRLFGYVRGFMSWVNKDMAVRLLGGETLMVLAKAKKRPLHD